MSYNESSPIHHPTPTPSVPALPLAQDDLGEGGGTRPHPSLNMWRHRPRAKVLNLSFYPITQPQTAGTRNNHTAKHIKKNRKNAYISDPSALKSP